MVKSILFFKPLPFQARCEANPYPLISHRSAWPLRVAAGRAASRLKGRNVLETELMSYKEMYYI